MTLLRTLTALRGVATLCAAAPILAVLGMSAPAQAQGPASARQATSLVGTWAFEPEEWWRIDSANGRLAGEHIHMSRTGQRRLGTLTFDLANSTSTFVKGLYFAAADEMYDLELSPTSDGQGLIGYALKPAWNTYLPVFLGRVQAVGDDPQYPTQSELLDRMAGVWVTPIGRLTIARQTGRTTASVTDPKTGRITYRLRFDDDLENQKSGYSVRWTWTDAANSESDDEVVTILTPDSNTLFVGYPQSRRSEPVYMGGQTRWTATRYGAPAPEPSNDQHTPPKPAPNTPPVVSPPADPSPVVTPPSQPGPVANGGFKPLNRVDARVDRVVVARGYPTYQVHAFVTVKNTSPGLQYFTSGYLKAHLTDADGVSLERSQPYRASGEPAELFMSTPAIQPGGELKVRYIFTPPEDARLTSLTLSEGGKRAEFPVSGL